MLSEMTPAVFATLVLPASDPSPARLADGLRALLGTGGNGEYGRVVRIEASFAPDPASGAQSALDEALELQAALHPGVQLVRSLAGTDDRVFCSPIGLPDWLTTRLRGQAGQLAVAARFTATTPAESGGELRAEVALQWLTEGEGTVTTLVNGVTTPAHGTPLLGLVAGLSRALEEEGLERNLLHYGMPALTRRRVLPGVSAVLALEHPCPRYSTPARLALASPDALALFESLVHRKVRALCREQPGLIEALLTRALGQPVSPGAHRGNQAA